MSIKASLSEILGRKEMETQTMKFFEEQGCQTNQDLNCAMSETFNASQLQIMPQSFLKDIEET